MAEPAALASDPKILASKLDELARSEFLGELPAFTQFGKWNRTIRWLGWRWRTGLNGILDDQIGFGVIEPTAIFLENLRKKGMHGPYLIITSDSGIRDWMALKLCCPATARIEVQKLLYHQNMFALFLFFFSKNEDMRAEEERWANLSKLHAILRLFLPREMEQNIENWFTQLIENGVTGSEDHAAIEGASTGAGSCQEVQAEVAFNDGGEGIPKNLQSSQCGLEGNKVKRPRRNDAPASPLEECNSSFQGPSKPAVVVQVPKPASSELIFKSLKEIPELARCDFLRAYGAVIRDDRQFESLMALPMDMRKDWLLMEIGNSDPSEAPAEEMDSKTENSGGEEAEADPARPVRKRRLPTRLAGLEWIR